MRFGLDLGGTKTEAIALANDGEIVFRRRKPTPRHDYPATLDLIQAMVAELEVHTGPGWPVGIGMPGTISAQTGLIKNANSTWLNGKPFLEDLTTRLGPRVRLANDANCFALSEATDGAAAGADIVFGVILGTGVGGGVVVGGSALTGANGISGEWGHNPLPWPEEGETPGSACYCGQSGCLETYLSGPGLSRDFAQRGGTPMQADGIVSLAGNGHSMARETLSTYQRRLARGLAQVINMLDPDVIVLGGGLSHIDSLYDAVPRLWQNWVFSDHVATRLVPNQHGDSSGVRGAAWLWPIPK